MGSKFLTMGVDVGGSYIKAALMEYGKKPKVLEKINEKIRKRNPAHVADQCIDELLEKRNVIYEDITYLASTGEGELVRRKRGHFYGMTTHARGAHFLVPDAKVVIDIGALYVRAFKIGEGSRVLNYKMTGQCASGSGQFIENISRYLGLSIEEVGPLSLSAVAPELPSGICAVLAETDVINMVSRGIETSDIIKGIHLSVAGRIVKILSALKPQPPIVLTGGMAQNIGMVEAIRETMQKNNMGSDIITHKDSVYAGAIGAALWGGFRHVKLAQEEKIEERELRIQD